MSYEDLLKHANIAPERVSGMVVVSLSHNGVVYSSGMENAGEKAAQCLAVLSASKRLASDEAVKMVRIRTESEEHFIISNDVHVLFAIVNL
ncbi:hypothetical protein TRVA0_065S00122 [Trichomonascus vanleenenianus]|uniref:uncharacterized protein n=1 Tax=Trichomonascus vanleenenianus TaxID=2268995 RepID=UPI003ECAC0B8